MYTNLYIESAVKIRRKVFKGYIFYRHKVIFSNDRKAHIKATKVLTPKKQKKNKTKTHTKINTNNENPGSP